MKSKLSTYISAIYGLVTLLCVISISFGLLYCGTQSDATAVALAASSHETPHEPIVEVDDQPPMVLVAMTSNGLEAQTTSGTAPATTAQGSTQATAGVDQEASYTQRVYQSARYLAAFLALGCYEGLPGAEEIYNQLLAELNIDFTAYDDIVAEIEAVTAALENAPEIWQHYADATLAAELLPA